MNQLLRNVQENCKINEHIIGCRALRIFSKCGKIYTPNTQILDSSLFWSGIDNSIKRICGIHWFCYMNIAEVNNSFQGMGTRKRQLIQKSELSSICVLGV
jgi:hypothetical protein